MLQQREEDKLVPLYGTEVEGLHKDQCSGCTIIKTHGTEQEVS